MDRFKKISDQVFYHTRWKLDWGSKNFSLLGINFSVNLCEITDMNYGIQIPKVIVLIQQRRRRFLKPIGRVVVIKTLLIPKLNHLFISIPNPKKEMISLICNAMFEFLWNSKVDKVTRNVITQDYFSGSLKLEDINSFIISLKCSWIKRLILCTCNWNKPWKDMFFAVNGKNSLVHLYDFGDTFVHQYLLNGNNAFWKDVLETWLC